MYRNFLIFFKLLFTLWVSKAQTDELQSPLKVEHAISNLNEHRHWVKNGFSQSQMSNLDKFDLKNYWNEFYENIDVIGPVNISAGCKSQIEQLYFALRLRKQWALEVIDSYGKMPSGVFNGNLAWLGEFGECLNITAENGSWLGRYVIVSKPIDPMDQFSPSSLSLKYGACVPNKCTQKDVYEIVNSVFKLIPVNTTKSLPFKLEFNETYVVVKEMPNVTYSTIVSLCVLGAFFALVLTSTIYDVCKRCQFYSKFNDSNVNLLLLHDQENENLIRGETAETGPIEPVQNHTIVPVDWENVYLFSLSKTSIYSRLIVNFSAYSNTKRLFNVDCKNSHEIKCLHGIRVLSLAWVILGHSFIFMIPYSDNVSILITWIKNIVFLIITNAFFSVDSFFMLSGFLTCYTFMREIDKTENSLNVKFMVKYYLHRLWRLTPAYAIAFLISLNLTPYFGNGPLFPSNGLEPPNCNSTWWLNFLYINNLVNAKNMCFGLSWYLANDTQFYFIAPIILIPFAMKKIRIGLFFSILLLVGNIVSITVTLYLNEGLESAQFGLKFGEFFTDFYILPWCRIGPYVVGILTAYLIIVRKKSGVIKIHQGLNIALWILSVLTCSLVVFGLYPDAKGENPLTRETRILYQALSKIAWSVSIGFMIYSCVMSKGGLINKILSWPFWIPLSRISYSTFLVHMMVIFYFNSTLEHLYHLEYLLMVYMFISNWVVSNLFGYLFNIFIETPITSLEKLLFR